MKSYSEKSEYAKVEKCKIKKWKIFQKSVDIIVWKMYYNDIENIYKKIEIVTGNAGETKTKIE